MAWAYGWGMLSAIHLVTFMPGLILIVVLAYRTRPDGRCRTGRVARHCRRPWRRRCRYWLTEWPLRVITGQHLSSAERRARTRLSARRISELEVDCGLIKRPDVPPRPGLVLTRTTPAERAALKRGQENPRAEYDRNMAASAAVAAEAHNLAVALDALRESAERLRPPF